MDKPRICIVVAIGSKTRAIGDGNKLLWHIPDDLRHFKELTLGYPVIQGRKTFESIIDILGKPLPGRHNIVLTRAQDYAYKGVEVAHSIDEALDIARQYKTEEIHIGGGEELYRQMLPHVDRIYLTIVESDKDGDTHFPIEYLEMFTKELDREKKEYNGLQYTWITLEK